MSEGKLAHTVASGSDLTWQCVAFDGLSVRALHRIHEARQEVFVVEQRCAFLDADEHDLHAWHLTARGVGSDVVQAYARLLAPGTKYDEASIGRVLTTAPARGVGLGRLLVTRALVEARGRWPGKAIRIGAQARLESFYASFGFQPVGVVYLEDEIPHIEMVLKG